ncbi:MAG TPA: imidazolonepropionase [Candidatus Dormibacteraeota bacterium]|nr:imidazolonepropionase [Candidatus Dormibacteraeota bacterium]
MSEGLPATLLVRGAGAVVTCDPARGAAPGAFASGCVVADGPVVVHVGPEAEMPRLSPREGFVELDARGTAVVPGFVDAHTHAIWMGSRSDEFARRAAGETYEEIARGGGGIASTVRATAAATVDELVAAGATRLRAMQRAGSTTVEVKSGYGLELDAELRMLDAAARLGADPSLPDVVPTWLPLHAVPEGARADFLDEVVARGVAAAASSAVFADAFCETGAFSVDECRRVLLAASTAGLRPRVHADQRSRGGGALLAAELGAASADHLEHAADADLRALAAAGVCAVLLPGAALVLGGPPPPGRRAVAAGATVALGTDCNPGTCYAESMPLMVALAVATAGLTPAEALAAATAGSARSLGLADRGRLAVGMRCDLCILESPDWIDVAYHLGAGPVRTVVRAGRVVSG